MAIRRRQRSKAIEFFRKAECSVIAAGFAWEISWQKQRLATVFSECDLLREAAWVILCSGFRETVVRKCFDYVSLCFCDWESATSISENRTACITRNHKSLRRRPLTRRW